MEIEYFQLDGSNRQLLSNVAEDVFDGPVIPAALEEFISCPRHAMMLAVDSGQVVGMASGLEYIHPDKSSQFFINEVGVAPAYQNQGIGRQLVEQLIDHATERGCSYAWLGTEKTNIAANRCYSSVRKGKEPEEFLLYEWEINSDEQDTPKE